MHLSRAFQLGRHRFRAGVIVFLPGGAVTARAGKEQRLTRGVTEGITLNTALGGRPLKPLLANGLRMLG